MGDPLSITASLIGILQATSVTVLCLQGMRHAPKDIKDFTDELGSLKSSFTTLRNYASANPNSTMLQTYDPRLRECLDDMGKLKAKLEPKGFFRKGILRLRWPLKGEECLKYMGKIERLKSDILLAMSVEQGSRSKAIAIRAERIEKGVEKITVGREQNSTLRQDEKRIQVLNWLNSTAYDERHLEISNRRQSNTGEWLLRLAVVVDWAGGSSAFRLLWGYGIPGAGKTFLSPLMIDYLRGRVTAENLNWGVAFMYFNHSEQNQQTPIFFLSSLVKQFACQLVDLPEELNKLYEQLHKKQTKPTFEELYSLLLVVIKQYTEVFIICDALDECQQDTQRTKLLPLFHRMEKDGMRLFLTSREYPQDIQHSLQSAVKIQLSAQNEDIRVYIERKIAENPHAESLVKHARCKEKIISELQTCANGIYLCGQTNPRQLLGALKTLKDSSSGERPMDPTYKRAMEAIQSQSKSRVELAFRILTWLVKSQRVLTPRELQQAVSVEKDHTTFDELALPSEKTMIDVCASLVTIDQEGNTVRLVHCTVKEYLVNNAIIPEDADYRLVMACATFLSYDDFSEGPCKTTAAQYARSKMYPFLDYAGSHFAFHLQLCDEALSVDLVLRFLKGTGNMLSYLQVAIESSYFEHCLQLEEFEDLGGDPSVNLAAHLGHTSAMMSLLKEAKAWNMMWWTQSALNMAVTHGYNSMIEVLFENGAEIHDEMLWEATICEHVSTIRLLIVNGASASATNGAGETPLHYAVNWKSEEVVEALLEGGADIFVPDRGGKTPLDKALRMRNDKVVKILIESIGNGAILDTNRDGQTLLHIAAGYRHQEGVRLLLEKGADISATDHKGRTPLHTARSPEVATILLEKGADISATDHEGRTPLHTAWSPEVVTILLEKGADISATDHEGRTPLHTARSPEVVTILLEKGADVSATDDKGQTPLHIAVSCRRQRVVRILLEKGADVSAMDHEGRTPLHTARSPEVVTILLEKGADISATTTRERLQRK